MQTYVKLEREAVCCEKLLLNFPPSRLLSSSGGTLNLGKLLSKTVTMVLFADDLLVVQNSFCVQSYLARGKKKGLQYAGQCLPHYVLI